MTLIPATNIPTKAGEAERLELATIGDCTDMPVTYVVLSCRLSPEEVAEAAEDMRRKVEAFGTIIGQAPPEDLTAMLDSLGSEPGEHMAAVGEAFALCWN